MFEDEKEEIECRMCYDEKEVEKGTWALENGMCEECWREYNGG